MVNYEAMNDPETFIPEHMRDGFKLWFENRISPGSFGMAVLTNDLKEAIGRADHINRNHINSIVAWLYNYAPNGSWGSHEAVQNWQRKAA